MSAGDSNHYSANGVMASPEALSAAAHYIEREYGYGYRLGISPAIAARSVTVFEVAHFDGSRFNIVADRWGNVERIPDGVTADGALDVVMSMAQKAVAS